MNIKRKLNVLSTTDTEALLMYVLYRLSEDRDYAIISELSFVLDQKNLFKFLEYFGGKVIRIPTKEQFLLVISALNLYDEIEIKKINPIIAYSELTKTKENAAQIIKTYEDIKDILKDDDFVH